MKRDGVAGDGVRFLVAGAINTLATSAVYFTLLLVLTPVAAYAAAWCCGIAFVVVFYPSRVFIGARQSTRARLAVGAVTVGVFLAGIALFRLVLGATVDPIVSYVVTLAATTVLNFTVSRAVLRRA